ncbi:unnamed protein product [Chrysoparadoxa australica]
MQRFPGTNSQETCFAHCSGLGFEVFANQYGVECFCGSQVELGSYGPSDGCVFPCPGNGSQLCGGSDANQVGSRQSDLSMIISLISSLSISFQVYLIV